MRLRRRLHRRLALAAAIVSAFSGEFVLSRLWGRPPGDRLEGVLSGVFVVLVAGGLALLAGYFEACEMAWRLAWDRYFDDEALSGVGTDLERWPRPPRQRRPRELDEPRDSAFWMKRLADRYARLERFEGLRAPEPILEQQRRMIRNAIAQLSPEDAIAVMRSWKDLDSARMKKRRKAPPAKGSN